MAVVLASLILGALVVFYFYLTRNHNYWQKRGIPCVDGWYPVIGHTWMFFTQTRADFCCKIYNDNKKHSMVGIYNCTSPSLMIFEPQLIRTVMQSDFASFHENGLKIDPAIDPLAAFNPIFSSDENWAIGRYCISYAFSSKRLKVLLESVKPACVLLENFLYNELKKSGQVIEIELKDLFSRFTAQVVAAATFGIEGFSFNEEGEDKTFRTIIQTILEPSIRNKLRLAVIFLLPWLNKLLRIRFLPKGIEQIFQTLIAELLEQRRANAALRQTDFLQLMVDLGRLRNYTFDVKSLTSHAMSIVINGFESSSTVLSFIGFHLATHPEVQNKLRNEILFVLKKHNGVVTYEALKDMTYMDQVLNESMRLVSVGEVLTKRCTEEFVLEGSDGLVCRVQPGTEIMIPVQGLHRDSRYWENPDAYDPDRFRPDRTHSIEKFTFFPFGAGPRICVGMRMAQLQMKACLAVLLRSYSFELSPKMQLPLKMIVGALVPTAKDGLWVNLQKV